MSTQEKNGSRTQIAGPEIFILSEGQNPTEAKAAIINLRDLLMRRIAGTRMQVTNVRRKMQDAPRRADHKQFQELEEGLKKLEETYEKEAPEILQRMITAAEKVEFETCVRLYEYDLREVINKAKHAGPVINMAYATIEKHMRVLEKIKKKQDLTTEDINYLIDNLGPDHPHLWDHYLHADNHPKTLVFSKEHSYMMDAFTIHDNRPLLHLRGYPVDRGWIDIREISRLAEKFASFQDHVVLANRIITIHMLLDFIHHHRHDHRMEKALIGKYIIRKDHFMTPQEQMRMPANLNLPMIDGIQEMQGRVAFHFSAVRDMKGQLPIWIPSDARILNYAIALIQHEQRIFEELSNDTMVGIQGKRLHEVLLLDKHTKPAFEVAINNLRMWSGSGITFTIEKERIMRWMKQYFLIDHAAVDARAAQHGEQMVEEHRRAA